MKFLYYAAINTIVVLALSFCSKHIEQEVPRDVARPAQEAEMQIDVKVVDETDTSVTLKFTPTDTISKYISLIIPTSEYMNMDEGLVSWVKKDIEEKAKEENKTFDSYLESIRVSGRRTKTVSSLSPFTRYNVVNFISNSKGELTQMPSPTTFVFRTKAFNSLNNLVVECHYDANKKSLNMVPDNKDLSYFVVCVPTKDLQQVKKEQDLTEEDIILNIFKNQLYNALQTGTPQEVEDVYKRITFKGDYKKSLASLSADTKFTYLIANIIVPKYDYRYMFLSSNIVRGEFTTPKQIIEAFPLSKFDIIYNENDDFFGVDIVPEDSQRTFQWRQGLYTDALKKYTPMQLADALLKTGWYPLPAFFLNVGKLHHDKIKLTLKGYPHYVIVFATDGRAVTSEPVLKVFETGVPFNPNDLTFNTKIKAIHSYDALVEFVPNDKRGFYAFAIMEDNKAIEANSLKVMFQKDLDAQLKAYLTLNNDFDTTYFVKNYYFDGVQTYNFNNLTPNTSYTLYTIALSKNAKVVKVNTLKSYLHTPMLSTAKVGVSLAGVYPVDSIPDKIISGISKFHNRDLALLVPKFTFEGTDSLITLSMPKTLRQKELDPAALSDSDIFSIVNSNSKINFSGISSKRPYMYILARWSEPQAIISFGVDKTGNYGISNRTSLGTPYKSTAKNVKDLENFIAMKQGGHNANTNNPSKILFTPNSLQKGDNNMVFGKPIIKQAISKHNKGFVANSVNNNLPTYLQNPTDIMKNKVFSYYKLIVIR